jgi:hypothetical protein
VRSPIDRCLDAVSGLLPSWARRERAIFLAILVAGIVVRVVARAAVPNGFNQDEAAVGYDAYAILKYGIDHHNIPYPAFLIGWGSGMNALSSYLAMPFIALFGLTEGATRSVNLLSGIVSLAVFYFLVRRLADGVVALWAVFLLAICPWHIMLSRWGLESNLLPGMFLLGVWLLLKGMQRPGFLVSAALCFALSLYAYGTAYFAVPVFLVLVSGYVLWKRKVAWRWYAVAAAVFVIVATPIGAVIWANQNHVASASLAGIGIPLMPTMPRYKLISSLFGPQALEHCFANLSTLWNLIAKQDDGLFWNAIAGQGLIYPFGSGLALIGLLSELLAVRWRGSFQPRFVMLLWLVTALALAAIQDSNINRINLLWLPVVYFAAVGLRTVARNRLIAVGLVAVHLAAFAGFASTYFGSYRERTASAFFPGFGQAINAASDAVPGKICVTNGPCMSYSFVLFYRRIDPNQFVRTVVYQNDGGEFLNVSAFDRYTFGMERCPDDTQAFIIDSGDVDKYRERAASIQQFSNYTVIVAKGKQGEL